MTREIASEVRREAADYRLIAIENRRRDVDRNSLTQLNVSLE